MEAKLNREYYDAVPSDARTLTAEPDRFLRKAMQELGYGPDFDALSLDEQRLVEWAAEVMRRG